MPIPSADVRAAQPPPDDRGDPKGQIRSDPGRDIGEGQEEERKGPPPLGVPRSGNQRGRDRGDGNSAASVPAPRRRTAAPAARNERGGGGVGECDGRRDSGEGEGCAGGTTGGEGAEGGGATAAAVGAMCRGCCGSTGDDPRRRLSGPGGGQRRRLRDGGYHRRHRISRQRGGRKRRDRRRSSPGGAASGGRQGSAGLAGRGNGVGIGLRVEAGESLGTRPSGLDAAARHAASVLPRRPADTLPAARRGRLDPPDRGRGTAVRRAGKAPVRSGRRRRRIRNRAGHCQARRVLPPPFLLPPVRVRSRPGTPGEDRPSPRAEALHEQPREGRGHRPATAAG
mmetsp:Transcript_55409/g.166112  ORF Transcript_55409/g.166112 Transcript_55409/m.166112 type:complete len:339 (+) Transcript_55409:1342-2358(+)